MLQDVPFSQIAKIRMPAPETAQCRDLTDDDFPTNWSREFAIETVASVQGLEIRFTGAAPSDEAMDCLAEVRDFREELLGDRVIRNNLLDEHERLRRNIFEATRRRKFAEAKFHGCSAEVREAWAEEQAAEMAMFRFKDVQSAYAESDIGAKKPIEAEEPLGSCDPYIDETQMGCAGELARALDPMVAASGVYA